MTSLFSDDEDVRVIENTYVKKTSTTNGSAHKSTPGGSSPYHSLAASMRRLKSETSSGSARGDGRTPSSTKKSYASDRDPKPQYERAMMFSSDEEMDNDDENMYRARKRTYKRPNNPVTQWIHSNGLNHVASLFSDIKTRAELVDFCREIVENPDKAYVFFQAHIRDANTLKAYATRLENSCNWLVLAEDAKSQETRSPSPSSSVPQTITSKNSREAKAAFVEDAVHQITPASPLSSMFIFPALLVGVATHFAVRAGAFASLDIMFAMTKAVSVVHLFTMGMTSSLEYSLWIASTAWFSPGNAVPLAFQALLFSAILGVLPSCRNVPMVKSWALPLTFAVAYVYTGYPYIVSNPLDVNIPAALQLGMLISFGLTVATFGYVGMEGIAVCATGLYLLGSGTGGDSSVDELLAVSLLAVFGPQMENYLLELHPFAESCFLVLVTMVFFRMNMVQVDAWLCALSYFALLEALKRLTFPSSFPWMFLIIASTGLSALIFMVMQEMQI